MAVDEVLLDTALTRGICSLRVYRWSEPTLSLGYFQNGVTHAVPKPLQHLPRVRRLSGGGAIVHDQELTYSCAVPPSHPLARSPLELYRRLHQRMIELLAGFSLPAQFQGAGEAPAETDFLCFGRRAAFDVVVAGCKVLGSAQRRRRGAVLQHGSLLLARSPQAPQFPGLFDVTGRTVGSDALIGAVAAELSAALANRTHHEELTAAEVRRSEEWAHDRYVLA